jgi:uncharacterized MAPEG superfamily protein
MADVQNLEAGSEPDKMPEGLDEKGLPKDKQAGGMHPFMFYVVWMFATTTIGVGIAVAVYYSDEDEYDKKIAVLKAGDLGYLYIAFWIFSLKDLIQQAFVSIGRKATGVNNPDQYVYEVVGKPKMPFVRLVQDGTVGDLNRAQRAIDNTRESFPMVAAGSLLAGYVYPFAVLVIAVIYTFARGLYSKGYVGKAAGRVPGHLLSYVTGTVVVNGLILFTGIKSFT